MRINIAPTQLAFLFPTYLVVDHALMLQSVAPSLAREVNPPREGDYLMDHFRLARREDNPVAAFTAIANRMEYLQLYGTKSNTVLAGTVIALEDGFLLATNRMPDAAALAAPLAKAANMGANESEIPVLMLVSIQKALLEEARATATQLAAERQRSEDMLTRFRRVAGFMAHDFNNLLSVVRLNADLLMQQRGLSQKVSRRIQVMAEVAERGSEITHSLMMLSSQKHDTCPPLAIDEHMHRQRAFFTTSLGAHHKIEFDLGADGAYAEVGRADLTNCVLNLIINARDAMPDGGTVSITTRLIVTALHTPGAATTPRHYVAITVRDTGTGMSDEVLARAFEPFFSTKSHGNGVGLASVQEFARNMGGDASVDSAPGEGTTVRIYLPRCDEPTPLAPAYDTPTVEETAAPLENREWRILLVDDEVHATAALAELLEGEGFVVTPATDYDQAASALSDQNFDLLLADVILPHSNGIALAKHACDLQPRLRVIMMSGYVPNAEEMRDDWQFMRKPLDPAKLMRMIRKTLSTDMAQAAH